MKEHPPSYRLDAHAAGDADAAVALHLATCDECRLYAAAVTAGSAEFAAHEGANAAAFVAGLPHHGRPRESPTNVLRMAWIAAPLLAAAAVLLVLRVPPPSPRSPPETVTVTRFKGNLQVAVVRDREGAQQRLAAEVSVRPGDRIRIEVGIDAEKPIAAGMLLKDGTWILLLAPTTLEAGTHYSDHAARFDDSPSEGWILAGHPEAVERARLTRMFDEVSVIPIAVER